MKTKLTKEEKEKLVKAFNSFLIDKCNLNEYSNKLLEKYDGIVLKDNDIVFEIINDFYMNKELHDKFITTFTFDDLIKFVEDNYKEILITNLDLDMKYIVKIDNSDALLDYSVENGSLVFKIKIILPVEKGNLSFLKLHDSIKKDIREVEKSISNIINIPVHIFESVLYSRKQV